MYCAIYKGNKKQDAYLYLSAKDDFSRVPDGLLKIMGRLQHVMDLELTPTRRLAQEDVDEVIRHLQEQGWFLQLPPKEGAQEGDLEPH